LGRAMIAEAATIDQERHVGPLGAALAQRRLIDRLAPRHQRARDLDHALERESWRLVWHAHARPEFALQECQQSPARAAADPTCVDPAAQQECATHFGDFPSERIARAALNAFAREHRLCPRLLGLEDAAGASVDRSGTRALVDSLETPGLTSTDAPASGALGESCAPGPLRAASASHTCAGLRAGECFGACTHPHPGSETPASHRGRALTALARLPRAFPAVRPGLAGYRESDDEQSEVHVFDGARYLGAARDADALAHLLARRQATLAAADRDPVDRVAVDPQPLQILTRVLKAAGSRIDRVVL
ncbi:MAG: hypothetical protein H7125_12800, partial [Proteobacteria bacterium]|nr:hypothetical protein [Burkholderiales bacterium]